MIDDATRVLRVLVVDDEPDIRELVQWGLQHFGRMRVWSAGTAGDALRLARQVEPDVVLLDAVLPDLDGVAALALFRANPVTASIPVIFCTGRVSGADGARFRAAGAVGVIAKPFDPTSLHARIRQVLQEAA